MDACKNAVNGKYEMMQGKSLRHEMTEDLRVMLKRSAMAGCAAEYVEPWKGTTEQKIPKFSLWVNNMAVF
jgi:hypothetical protein